MNVPTTVSSAHGQGFGVKLNGKHFRLGALNQGGEISTSELGVPRVDTAGSPEEIRSSGPERAFGRSDFTGGMGLPVAHRNPPGDDDGRRYWDSHMMDVLAADDDGPARIHPLPPTYLLDEGTMGDGGTKTTYWGHIQPVLYAWGQQLIYLTPNGAAKRTLFGEIEDTDAWDVQATLDDFGARTGGGVIVDDTLYVQSEIGVLKFSDSGVWSVYNPDIQLLGPIFGAKGKILYDIGGLREIHESGTADTVILPTPGGSTVDVIDYGAFVLAAVSNGYVYAMTVDPETGDWVQQSQSRIRPGLAITAITSVAGQLFIGTLEARTRAWPNRSTLTNQTRISALWRAQVDTDGALVGVELIREFDEPIDDLVTWRNSVYALAWPTVWRYDLTYAALHRHTEITGGTTGEGERKTLAVQQVGIPPGTERDRLFVLTNGDITTGTTAKLYATQAEVDGPAVLTLPVADLFTAEPKHWTSLTVTQEPGTLGGMWSVYHTGDPQIAHGRRSDVTQWTYAGVTGADTTTEIPIDHEGRYLAIRLYYNLLPGYTPRAIYGVSADAVLANETEVFTLPIDVSDHVERPNRKPFNLHKKKYGLAKYAELRAMEGEPVTAEIVPLGITVTGIVERVATTLPGYTPRGSPTLVAPVTIRGKET